MEMVKYRELLKIQAVSVMNLEYFNFMKDFYDGIIDPSLRRLPEKPRSALDLSNQETKNKIIDMFAAGKRGMGYGR